MYLYFNIFIHNPAEIILINWFDSQEMLIIIIHVENSCAAIIFEETALFFFFLFLSGFFDE